MEPNKNQSAAVPSDPSADLGGAMPTMPEPPAVTESSAASDLASNASGMQPIIIAPTHDAPSDASGIPVGVSQLESTGKASATPSPSDLSMPEPSAWTEPAQTGAATGQVANADIPAVSGTGVQTTGLSGAVTDPSGATPTPTASLPASPTAPSGPAAVPSAQRPPKKKKLLLAGGIGLGVLLLAGGVVFGWYLPNTPGNVWKTGINRTGQAIDTLMESATTAEKLKSYQTSEIKGSVDVTADDATYSGTFQSKADQSNLDAGLDVTLKANDQTAEFGAKVLMATPKDTLYPNIYFQFSGLDSLGLDAYVPNISDYDSKWIFISSDWLESLGADYLTTDPDSGHEVTAEDMSEVAKAAARVTNEYVFTTDEDKAVLVQRSFVGKETVDGVKAYHYKVALHKEHLEDYCVALSGAVLSTKAYQDVTGLSDDELANEKDQAAKDCKAQAGDAIKNTATFDLWIDSKYKIIHKVRIYDPNDNKVYTDIGQLYKGGDKLSLFVAVHDGSTAAKADGKFTVEIDLKTSSVKARFAYEEKGDYPYTIRATFDATVSDKAVTITEPESSVPIETFLNDTLGPVFSGVQSAAKDTERQTDINALRAHLEAYYANNNGYYPTLAQLNSSTWRSANMQGLDAEAFTPPDSASNQLAGSPSATQYGYAPTQCSAAGCTAYTLSALMSDGSIYGKDSL